MGETVAGGRYLDADGNLRNANGELLEEAKPATKKPVAKKPTTKATETKESE